MLSLEKRQWVKNLSHIRLQPFLVSGNLLHGPEGILEEACKLGFLRVSEMEGSWHFLSLKIEGGSNLVEMTHSLGFVHLFQLEIGGYLIFNIN